MSHQHPEQPSQRRHESPELGAMIRRMVRALVRRAAEGDTEALEQLAIVERDVPMAVSVAIARMNVGEAGYSYTELAGVVGTTRQAARQRAVRITTDDDVAAYYSDGASRSLDWSIAHGEA